MASWTYWQASCDTTTAAMGFRWGNCVCREPALHVASMALSVSGEEPMNVEVAASLVQRFMNPHLCPMKQREMGDEIQVREFQVVSY